MKMTKNLKPCPFCGGEAEIRLSDLKLNKAFIISLEASARVRCKKCFFEHTAWTIRLPIDEQTLEVKSTLEKETKHIVEKWNRRGCEDA